MSGYHRMVLRYQAQMEVTGHKPMDLTGYGHFSVCVCVGACVGVGVCVCVDLCYQEDTRFLQQPGISADRMCENFKHVLLHSCRGMWHSCPTTCNEAVDMSGKRESESRSWVTDVAAWGRDQDFTSYAHVSSVILCRACIHF